MRVLGWSMRLGSIAFAVTVSLMFFQNCGGSFGVSENSARSLVSEHFDQFQSDQAQYKVDQLATGKLVENPMSSAPLGGSICWARIGISMNQSA